MWTINLEKNPEAFLLQHAIETYLIQKNKMTFTLDDIVCNDNLMDNIYNNVYLIAQKRLNPSILYNDSSPQKFYKTCKLVNDNFPHLINIGCYNEFSSSQVGKIMIFLYKYNFTRWFLGRFIEKLKISQKIRRNLIYIRNYPLDTDEIFQNYQKNKILWKGLLIGFFASKSYDFIKLGKVTFISNLTFIEWVLLILLIVLFIITIKEIKKSKK